MNGKRWQTKEQLLDLLCKLVEIPSITGSRAEIQMAENIIENLIALPYFHQHPDYIHSFPTEDGRKIVTALVKKEASVQNTIVLVSHFDVVNIEDYGEWKPFAFDSNHLNQVLHEHEDLLPTAAREHLREGNWLFGRGTMDMKCGLALHMSMLERAADGEFDGNLLLLTVCDEESNSVGMRTAVPILNELAKQYNLNYIAMVNSEPIFTRYPGDLNNYVYTGSIGKILPGFLCYGKETHVGEPFSGLNANYMASLLTCELELNSEFCQIANGEVTPPPTNLIQKDLKDEYSAQIPHCAVMLFNLFLFEKPMDEVVQQLLTFAHQVARRIEQSYTERATRYAELESSNPMPMQVRVLDVSTLLEYATNVHGKQTVERIQADILRDVAGKDDRDISIQLVKELAALCKELAPMIVVFFAPPYYPAITSCDNTKIENVVEEITQYAEVEYRVKLTHQHYFGGISDLSYAGLQQSETALQSLIMNMPLWEKGYSLPLEDMRKLNVPVLNLGPIGKDAHKWTERLDVNYAFEVLPSIITKAIHKLLTNIEWRVQSGV